MATRRVEKPTLQSREFSRDEIDRGIRKLRKRIEEVKQLDPQSIAHDDARVEVVEGNIRDTIADVFGPQSPEFDRHKRHRIFKGPGGVLMNPSREFLQRCFAAGIPDTLVTLENLISRLEEKREDAPIEKIRGMPIVGSPATTRSVFVVHGHDQAAAQAVSGFWKSFACSQSCSMSEPAKAVLSSRNSKRMLTCRLRWFS
jgi:hypothetical protein